MAYENELDRDMAAFIRALPKAELHVHLEGTIRPSTLLRLARRHRIELPVDSEEGLRQFYKFRDFPHFIEVWVAVNQCLRGGEDFELVTLELAEEADRQNIRYLEVTFTPYPHFHRKGVPWDEIIGGISSGVGQARRSREVEMRLIPDIARESYSAGLMVAAERTAEWAVAAKDMGVVALGLGGMEVGNPPEAFADVFAHAIENGLHSVPHAGETTGPQTIWGSLEHLKAERIGHGIRCVDDPELVRHLRDHQIPLEICPTSNVCTGAVPSLEAHPIRRLYDEGVYVTVNSDDPPMFNTTLLDEYMLLAARFGFSRDELAGLSLNAVRASFLSPEEKQRIERQFQAEIDRIL